MVSKLQRHLSLLLVVVITSSWLVVPSALQAQSVITEGAPGEGTVTVTKTGEGYDFFTKRFSTPPTLQHTGAGVGFYNSKKDTIIHRFKAGSDYYDLTYKKSGTGAAGCGGSAYVWQALNCSEQSSAANYNFFANKETHFANGNQVWKTFKTIEVYTMENEIPDLPIKPVLLRYENNIYGLFYQAERQWGIEYIPYIGTSRSSDNPTVATLNYYAQSLNCAHGKGINPNYSASCSRTKVLNSGSPAAIKPGSSTTGGSSGSTSGSASGSTGNAATKTLSATDKASTEEAFKEWFDPERFRGTFTLKDNRESLAAGEKNPTKPPIVVVTPNSAGDSLPEVLTFQLKYVRGVAGGWWKNNYFLFQLTESPSDTVLPAEHIYLVIDLNGNIAFVTDSPEKTIFSDEEDNLDDNVIQIGGKAGTDWFNADEQKSFWRINLDEYKRIITTRVYNERNKELPSELEKLFSNQLSSTAFFILSPVGSLVMGNNPIAVDTHKKVCGAIVGYGQTNTSYETFKPTTGPGREGIPGSTTRLCINGSEGGWLHKWGVKFNKLDSSSTPNSCITYFGGDGWFNFAGKAICWALGTIIGGAVWATGFSVELLIEAAGLQ